MSRQGTCVPVFECITKMKIDSLKPCFHWHMHNLGPINTYFFIFISNPKSNVFVSNRNNFCGYIAHDLAPPPRNSLSVPKIEKNTNLGPPINSPSVPEVEHEIWQPYSAWRNVCLGKQKYNIMHQWLWLLHSNPPLTCPALHFPFLRIRKEKKEQNAAAGVTIRTGLMYFLWKYNTPQDVQHWYP